MLVVKAAVQMHWFGSSYAAGDVIDTTGYDDHAMAQLLKTQPVYVSDTSGGSSSVSRGVVEFTDPYTGSAGSWAPTLVISVAQDWIALKDGDATTLVVQPGTYLARYFVSLSVNAVTGVALHPQSNPDVGPEVAALSDSGSAVEVVETYVFDAPTEMWPTLVGAATATNPQGDVQLLKLA